jgi:mRNA-degrading endonuclease toxin of MazEF toxin-antitoxin module
VAEPAIRRGQCSTTPEIPLHVRVAASKRTGLRAASFVKCEQVMTVSKDRLSAPIGRLDAREMAEVDLAIALSLGLPVPP